jgi:hypothetical protein
MYPVAPVLDLISLKSTSETEGVVGHTEILSGPFRNQSGERRKFVSVLTLVIRKKVEVGCLDSITICSILMHEAY